MAFTLTLVDQDDTGITGVAAQGEAMATDFPSAHSVHFDDLLGPGWNTRGVLLDMDRVNYIDSSAVGWLLGAQKRFRAGGGRLVLHSLQPQVKQILNMLKIGQVIPLAADREAGRAVLAALIASAARS